jgi:diguanylate cyclase (GGDEF)-like protein
VATQEESFKWLVDLGNPAERRTRAELLDRAFCAALMLTNADAVVAWLPQSRGTERLALHAGSDVPARLKPARQGSEIVKLLAENCQPIALPNLSESPASATDACPGVDAGPALFTPVRLRNQGPAYVAVYRKRGRVPFSTNDIRMMLILAAWLSTALENLRLATGGERLSVKDELTEVYNHRFLKTALQREVRRAGRFGQDLSVVMIDVDSLGAFTEVNGELRGSLLLKELTTVLVQQVRSFDVMGRNGDDEFMLILPQTNLEGAVEVAERMRGVVEQYAFSHVPAGAITVSLGVASFPAAGSKAEDLVAAADRALEQAKQRGRNRVETIDRAA